MDLKFPKELSKKKKIELYKAYILDPLPKGSPTRPIDLNIDIDWFGLTEKAAFEIELNRYVKENYNGDFSNAEKFIHGSGKDSLGSKHIVIVKFILLNGVAAEDVIIPPLNANGIDTDPGYDPIRLTLHATIRDRNEGIEIKDYNIDSINAIYDEAVHLYAIENVDFIEKIINKSVTGG